MMLESLYGTSVFELDNIYTNACIYDFAIDLVMKS